MERCVLTRYPWLLWLVGGCRVGRSSPETQRCNLTAKRSLVGARDLIFFRWQYRIFHSTISCSALKYHCWISLLILSHPQGTERIIELRLTLFYSGICRSYHWIYRYQITSILNLLRTSWKTPRHQDFEYADAYQRYFSEIEPQDPSWWLTQDSEDNTKNGLDLLWGQGGETQHLFPGSHRKWDPSENRFWHQALGLSLQHPLVCHSHSSIEQDKEYAISRRSIPRPTIFHVLSTQ